MSWVEQIWEKPERSERSVRMFRLRRNAAGLARGDVLYVVPGAKPEGGEFVIDSEFRLGRSVTGGECGGPVWGVVVGMIRRNDPAG